MIILNATTTHLLEAMFYSFEEKMGSCLSRDYLRISERTESNGNSISAFNFLFPNRYPLHQPHIHYYLRCHHVELSYFLGIVKSSKYLLGGLNDSYNLININVHYIYRFPINNGRISKPHFLA